MFYPEFTQDYIQRALAEPRRFGADAQNMLETSEETRRLYHGIVIPMTYQGIFFPEETVHLFEEIIATMVSIGRKITAEYVKNPDYRPGFHFDAKTEDLILIDPGYDIPVPVGRYDIFYNGGTDFKFCELNTDGSSAMNEDRVLGGLLSETELFRAMAEDWDIQPFSLFDTLVSRFLTRYRALTGRDCQSVAIVDALEKGTSLEFEVFCDAFRRAGVSAVIADVRDLTYTGGRLWAPQEDTAERLPIDLVYRRLVTSDYVALADAAQPFEQAYRDRAFLSFGSFRSQVMHAKTIFSMMHDPRTQAILSDAENAFVAAHVPWTKDLVSEEDKARVIAEKDAFILKPYNSYASQGILLGREHEPREWAQIIRDLPLDRYIYQEYVDVDPTPFVELNPETGALEETRLGHVIGLFLYDEAFAGSYTRVGRHGLISGARPYYSAPAFVVRRKA